MSGTAGPPAPGARRRFGPLLAVLLAAALCGCAGSEGSVKLPAFRFKVSSKTRLASSTDMR